MSTLRWPKDVIAGHDPQLERAVREAMRMMKEKPVNRGTKNGIADLGRATQAIALCDSTGLAIEDAPVLNPTL